MVALEVVQQSNRLLAILPHAQGLVAVFIGATSGIGQSALEHFAKHTNAPRIYSVARSKTAASHSEFLETLRKANPSGTYMLLTADASLLSDIDSAIDAVMKCETKVDLLFMSPGFFAFEGRQNTQEGLDPSMSTRYYSRLRALQRLLPLLNNSAARSPRVVSVLAAGEEKLLNEDDLDLSEPQNWSVWNASHHACTMGTPALERVAYENPRLSIAHCHPGAVATPGLARSNTFGLRPPNPMDQDEAGQRAVFYGTNDRYATQQQQQDPGLVPVPEGLKVLEKTAGGVFLVGPLGESKVNDSEAALASMRERGVDKKVWKFTQDMFDTATTMPTVVSA
jgi:NAD(P)-dependent dehydrogenase (short-subunit alcohol dehydrogenase family)